MRRAGGPRIELHPGDAAARGLSSGDRARVFNARGTFLADVGAVFHDNRVQVQPAGVHDDDLHEPRDPARRPADLLL